MRPLPLLQLTSISKNFCGVQALIDVDFTIEAGEVHCLAGENGCGKSTLIKVISGVHTPEAGANIRFDDQTYERLDPVTARRLGVQVIWQDLALFPHLSVAENIAFEHCLGGTPRLLRKAEMRRVAQQVLDRLGMQLDLSEPIRSLSIAQRQVVAICRALVADARIVFMDEPTASLTQAETDALLDVVRRLSSDGIAVVFISHRLAEIIAIADRVTVLRDGRLVGVYPATEMSQGRLVELMTGRSIDHQIIAQDRSNQPIILETRGLSRTGEYDDISISIRRGETLGLIGLLGAGRTELAKTLFGMTRADEGEILLNDRDLKISSNRAAIDAGIAYVSEDRLSLGLVQPQSIADNIVLTVLSRVLDTLGLINDPKKSNLVDDWVKRLAIRIGLPEDPVATLSGGNQQRVVLAKWLATEPKVLLLDSPTVGVDVGARAGLFNIVQDLASQGLAILLISDEITEVYHNADRVLHMRGGRIEGEFIPGHHTIEALEQAVHG